MLTTIARSPNKLIDLNTNQLTSGRAIDYWNDYVCENFIEAEVSKLNEGAFSGSIKGCQLNNGLQISKVVANPHHVVRTKSQIAKGNGNHYLIGLQLDGKGIIRQDGRENILNPRDWTIYDSSRPYELIFQENFRHLVLHFPKNLLPLVPEYYQYTATRFDGSKGYGKILSNLFSVAEQEMYSLEESELNQLSTTLLDMLSQFLLANLKELKKNDNFVLAEAKNYILKNIFESTLSAKSICAALNCSIRTLQYAFQKESSTITEYIKEQRLNRVHKLLSNSSYDYYSISQIAYLVGFKSASHFSTVFTKKYLISPSCFRTSRGQLS